MKPETAFSPTRLAWKRFLSDRLVFIALIVFIIVAVLCLIGPQFAKDPAAQDLQLKAALPSLKHWMGTDTLGRDIFSRVLHGGRISLLVGILATAVAVTIGVIVGGIAGYAGGWLDAFLMRTVDVLYAFPLLIFLILLSVVLGDPLDHWLTDHHAKDLVPIARVGLIFVAVGAVEWPTIARIVRGQVLSLRSQDFIAAAVCLGNSPIAVFRKHLLPNALPPVIAYATLTVPGVMLLESALSYLGLGVQAPASSWGSLIKDGADNMETAPWLLIFPGIIFTLTLLSLLLIGDGLRSALDPKQERRA